MEVKFSTAPTPWFIVPGNNEPIKLEREKEILSKFAISYLILGVALILDDLVLCRRHRK